MALINGIAHVNLVVPKDTLDAARAFYSDTLGFVSAPVPVLQRSTLAWFNIGDSGQQIHVAFGRDAEFAADAPRSSRHPCFRVANQEALLTLQKRIWAHRQAGTAGAPQECDEPGGESSGSKGVEYPRRFFARDYGGNRLEFSL
ncbi:glyoxalase family protein [Niveomyces insectorum RCEF 264]|uniref:Glyoxalase family protein n=1 Tax=Niveomyces insectorum RCEF 264 TaxID=1081102 RepID=A0A167Z229_9HYPO|nr:glyoxalase family protein [Niveomyces insectorum RCEF 264]